MTDVILVDFWFLLCLDRIQVALRRMCIAASTTSPTNDYGGDHDDDDDEDDDESDLYQWCVIE